MGSAARRRCQHAPARQQGGEGRQQLLGVGRFEDSSRRQLQQGITAQTMGRRQQQQHRSWLPALLQAQQFFGQAPALEVAAAGLPDHQLGQPLQLLWSLSDAVQPRLSREQAGEAIAQQRFGKQQQLRTHGFGELMGLVMAWAKGTDAGADSPVLGGRRDSAAAPAGEMQGVGLDGEAGVALDLVEQLAW